MVKKYKIAVLISHPIQYQAPLFRKLAQHPEIDLMVYFCSDHGVTEKVDPGFGVAFKWDIPLLEGYRYKFLKNYFPFVSGGKLWLSVNPGIIKELWKEEYDAILVHDYVSLTNWLAFLGAWLTITPILFRGETILRPDQSRIKRAVKSLYLKALFRKINAFLPIGTRSREFYLAYGARKNRLFFTPYSVDNKYFFKENKKWHKEKMKIKKEIGNLENNPVILYVGKIYGLKGEGPLHLLKAFEKIQKDWNASLIFVGDGKERVILETYLQKNNIRNVYFLGFKNQSELPKYYSIADIFVLPSLNETWGLTINEAMCFSLPIITTSTVGASSDLVCHGKNGFIYTAGEINSLSGYLAKLLSGPLKRKEMGKLSLKIISNWNYDVCVEGILKSLEFIQRRNR
ncbi:D-inositol-3-phosphate glycosyltransferase [subsurface metagenome]